MAYQIELIQDDDFDHIVPRMFAAFDNDYEFINSVYPNHDTSAEQNKTAKRFKAMTNMAKNVTWVKAVETSTTEAVGIAVWTLIDDTKPPETELDGPAGTWPSEEGKKYCQALHRALLIDRRRAVKENNLPLIVVNMMVIFSEYQRKGVGKLLMESSLEQADKRNALCMVESTQTARKLYEAGGFQIVRDYHLDAGEAFADRPKDHLLFMIRQRTGIK